MFPVKYKLPNTSGTRSTRSTRSTRLHCTKENKKNKLINKRKEELKSIFNTFQDVSKQEITRFKSLWDSHVELFDEPEKEVIYHNDVSQALVNDDGFFE